MFKLLRSVVVCDRNFGNGTAIVSITIARRRFVLVLLFVVVVEAAEAREAFMIRRSR